MEFDGNKKTLFVIGMDQDLQPLLQQVTNIAPENLLTIQIYRPEIAEPYGDLMRDIILAVYRENIEEIFVIGTAYDEQVTLSGYDLQRKIDRQEEMKNKVKAIDFLFQNCMPEFPGGTLSEWLAGAKTAAEGIQKSVELLRDHPLLPSDVDVCGLLMDRENGKLSELRVS